jgi:hypothetical protein
MDWCERPRRLAMHSGGFAAGQGKGFDGRGGGGRGGSRSGGGRGGGKGGKPFWRQFVDASDDPEVISWCQEWLEAFLSSGQESAPVELMPHAHRNTLRSMAPQMGCAWRRAAKVEYELVRAAPVADASVIKREVVEAIRRLCEASGGKCAASRAWRELAPPLQAQVQTSLSPVITSPAHYLHIRATLPSLSPHARAVLSQVR